MSRYISGVEPRICRVNPKAVYIHCRAHVLNLCIVHDSKLPIVRNIMDTMQAVSLAFNFSAKCLLVFEEQLGNSAAVGEKMGKRSKLKILFDCLDVFVTSFEIGLEVLMSVARFFIEIIKELLNK